MLKLIGRMAAICLLASLAAMPQRGNAQTFASEEILERAGRPWTGDLDQMIDRGFIRILTVYNPIYFSYQGHFEEGLLVEISRELNKRLVEWHKLKNKPFTIVLIPVPRDELIPRLLDGRGDMVAANLTITPDRLEKVDFTDPTYTGVDELIVTHKSAGKLKGFDDVAALGLSIRKSSSYYEHLAELNTDRANKGEKPIPIAEIDERMEDYDILELVNAGTVPATVVDSHKAALWKQVYDDILVQEELKLNTDGQIAYAFRKDSPVLKKSLNRFVKEIRKGSLIGNILIKKYVGNRDWVTNNLEGWKSNRSADVIAIIQRKSVDYGFDWLMIVSQAYQESRLDQSKRSHVGAIGIMQMMPTTANDPVVGIPDITVPERNVEAGVKYLAHLRTTYFDDPSLTDVDKTLFSIAAYNAGPGGVQRARRTAAKMNLNPDVWFGNVEVAAARSVSREPVIYVRNILKYYVAYKNNELLSQSKNSISNSAD